MANALVTVNGIESVRKGRKAEVTLCLVSVHRYITDPAYFAVVTTTEQTVPRDAYDLVFTDGAFLTKMALHSSLSKHVERGELKPGQHVVAKSVVRRYDESHIDPSIPTLVVMQLEIKTTINLMDTTGLEFYEAKYVEDQAEGDKAKVLQRLRNAPLIGSRGCYLHLLCDDPLGVQWSPKPVVVKKCEAMEDIMTKPTDTFLTFNEINEDYDVVAQKPRHKQVPKTASHLVVFGRVLAKSRVGCWAKSNENRKFPFRCSMLLGMNTARCEVFFWESATMNFHPSVEVGDLIALRGPRIKPSYLGDDMQTEENPAVGLSPLESSNDPLKPKSVFELSVSPQGNTSINQATVIQGSLLELDELVNVFPMEFTAVGDLEGIAAGTVVNFSGQVLWMSAVHRRSLKYPSASSRPTGESRESYEVFRFLRLRHKEDATDVVVAITPNSDWASFQQSAGLLRSTIATGANKTVSQLLPTHRSQIFDLSDKTLPAFLLVDPVVRETRRMKGAPDGMLRPSVSGPDPSFWWEVPDHCLWYQKFQSLTEWNQYFNRSPDEDDSPGTPLALLEDVFQRMKYKEAQDIVLTVCLKQICFKHKLVPIRDNAVGPFATNLEETGDETGAIILVCTALNPSNGRYQEINLAVPVWPVLADQTEDIQTFYEHSTLQRRIAALREFLGLTATITNDRLARLGNAKTVGRILSGVAREFHAALKQEILHIAVNLFFADTHTLEMVATNVFRTGTHRA